MMVRGDKMKAFFVKKKKSLNDRNILHYYLSLSIITSIIVFTFIATIIWTLDKDGLQIDQTKVSYFQGLTPVTPYFSDILKTDELIQFDEQEYIYELWRVSPYTGERLIIGTSTKLIKPVERAFKIVIRVIVSMLMVLLIKTILELKNRKKELEQIAFFDMLTNLPNRRLLYDRLQQAVTQTQNTGNFLAICYLDIDNLKPVNDTMGHKTGDLLLIEIAHRFKSCVRSGDTVSRIGGDEFVIILQNLKSLEECDLILNRILKSANTPIILGHNCIETSVSIGVSFYSNDNKDIDTLLRQADHAMYQAKRLSKGNYHIFGCHDINSI